MIANVFLRRWALGLGTAVLLAASVVDTCQAQLQGTIPSVSFERAIETLYEGRYRRAERAFVSELRGAVKTVQSRWVDSICYHTMLGELAFQRGQFDAALQQFDQACQLQLAFPKWLLKVQFGSIALRADTNRLRRVAPWGPGQRQVVLANLPRSLSVMQGQMTTEQDLRRQGPTVVSPLQLWKVDVVEVIRCSALAIRRRNQLLGPLGRHDRVTRQLVQALARGGAPPNHWSNAWIDLQLGLAYAGQGEIEQALTHLNRATLLAGQFDHPLTCVALLEQGRLALLGGNAGAAARLFGEASLSAFTFEDWGVVSEAIQLLQESQLAAQKPAAPFSLELALAWARQNRLDHLVVHWSIGQGEALAAGGQADAAEAALSEAFARLGEMRNGLAGSRYNYALALAQFGQQRAADGNKTLAKAVAAKRGMSRWNYQISLTTKRYDSGQLSQRDATKLYAELLRDPGPIDWALRPYEALTHLATSHSVAFNRWFLATLQRGDIPAALEVADLAKRHRFHASLPWGGRLFGLRMLLESPQQALNPQAALQKQELLLRYPAYQALSTEGQDLRSELAADISAVEPERLDPVLVKKYTALGRNIDARESILQTIAVRREPASNVFPPRRSLGEVQSRLQPGQALVVFHAADNRIQGFLITSAGTTQWNLPPRAQLQREVAGFLRDLGNYEANRPLTIKEATDDGWQTSGATLWAKLLGKSRLNLSKTSELIIVPDGILWYLPFEALSETGPQAGAPLIDRVPMRYAPTMGLASQDEVSWRPTRHAGIVAGQLFPDDDEETVSAAVGEIREVVSGPVLLSTKLALPSHVVSSCLEELIVIDDLDVDPRAPFGWSPIQRDGARAGVDSLAQWLTLPHQGPQRIILPGFHSRAERGLKVPRRRGAVNTPAGHELFAATCGLMAGGAKTILLSRWRVGGQASIDLVREFAQELPHTVAADAWQRSVQLTLESRLDLSKEPRLKSATNDPAPTARHPFFWAGYLLVDVGTPPGDRDEPPPPARQAAIGRGR